MVDLFVFLLCMAAFPAASEETLTSNWLREPFEFRRNVISHVKPRLIRTHHSRSTKTILPYDRLPSISFKLTDNSTFTIPKASSHHRSTSTPPTYFLIMCSPSSPLSQRICDQPQEEYMQKAPPNAIFIFMAYGSCWIPKEALSLDTCKTCACHHNQVAAIQKIEKIQTPSNPDLRSRVKFVAENPALIHNAFSEQVVNRPEWSDEILRLIIKRESEKESVERTLETPEPRTSKLFSQAKLEQQPRTISVFRAKHDETVSALQHLKENDILATPLFGCNEQTYVDVERTMPAKPLAWLGSGCKLNGDEKLKDRVAVIERGECMFEEKLANAVKAGAVGAIIISSASKPPIPLRYKHKGGCNGNIPAIMVSNEEGNTIKQKISTGESVVPHLEVGIQPPVFLGIDAQTRIRTVGSLSAPSLEDSNLELSSYNYDYRISKALQTISSASPNKKVELFNPKHHHLGEFVETEMTLPQKLSAFPRLHVHLQLQCKDRLRQNCGEWDQLLHLHVRPKGTEVQKEGTSREKFGPQIARWITPYSSEGQWVTDLSPMLPVIASQGKNNGVIFRLTTVDGIRVDHNVSMDLLFSHAHDELVSHSQPAGSTVAVLSPKSHHKRANLKNRKHKKSQQVFLETDQFSKPQTSLKHQKTKVGQHHHSKKNTHYKIARFKERERPALSLHLFSGGLFEGFNDPQKHHSKSVRLRTAGNQTSNCKDMIVERNRNGTWEKLGSVSGHFTRAEVVMIVTGHGWGSGANCAEFCDHQHIISFESKKKSFSSQLSFPNSGSMAKCQEYVSSGVTPNQYGTWTIGRSGWCPGLDVPTWRTSVPASFATVTDAGHELKVLYKAMFQNQDFVGGGNQIDGNGFPATLHSESYLVFYSSPC